MVTGRAGAAERRGTRRPGQRFVPVDYPGPRLEQQSIKLLAFRKISPQERPKRVAFARAIASSKCHSARRKQRAKDLFVGTLATRSSRQSPASAARFRLQPARLQQGFPPRRRAARPDALCAACSEISPPRNGCGSASHAPGSAALTVTSREGTHRPPRRALPADGARRCSAVRR
jgi:hypothetical protein